MSEAEVDVLFIEPFCGGSHKQLMDLLATIDCISSDFIMLPAKKWHWKARTSALYCAQIIEIKKTYKTVFCSSVLNLCELLGLCPNLSKCKKIVYFHENQLVYPVRKREDGDFQYGYNQILTALCADLLVFNSQFNMTSFLSNIDSFLKLVPDHRPKCVKESLVHKCFVLYFPISDLPDAVMTNENQADVLHIVWPHRWEHDKNPDEFFHILLELKKNNFKFVVSVLGEQYSQIPSIFETAKASLGVEYIKHWGFVQDKLEYYSILQAADVSVSTAKHEFFGVSMMESAMCGCFPLCPNRLSYPELFPSQCIYNTDRQLYKRLREYCTKKHLCKVHFGSNDFKFDRFSWQRLKPEYSAILGPPIV